MSLERWAKARPWHSPTDMLRIEMCPKYNEKPLEEIRSRWFGDPIHMLIQSPWSIWCCMESTK
jgi:hypothetical protein